MTSRLRVKWTPLGRQTPIRVLSKDVRGGALLASMVSRVIFYDGMLQEPPHPRPLSPKGARGELILLPSPPWGRGWLDEASSSAEVRRVRGSRLLSILRWDTTLGTGTPACVVSFAQLMAVLPITQPGVAVLPPRFLFIIRNSEKACPSSVVSCQDRTCTTRPARGIFRPWARMKYWST